MRYQCRNCGETVVRPLIIWERHGLEDPPYEALQACPCCRNAGVLEVIGDADFPY